MKRIAVLLTVYNRKEITINGIATLYNSIKRMPATYKFDVYLTDDASPDGTGEAVRRLYPQIKVINGSGSLFWGGGMLKSWETALQSGVEYDCFLWYNDDSLLFENALVTIFSDYSDNWIITGAFCGDNGTVSYGGKDKNNRLLTPDGTYQSVHYMNGNLVLIPSKISAKIGIINRCLLHGGGDFEFGLRAQKSGYQVFLSTKYVGICNRHDEIIPKYCQTKYKLRERFKILRTPFYNPYAHFYFNCIAHGLIRACFNFILCYVGAFSPSIYKFFKLKFGK